MSDNEIILIGYSGHGLVVAETAKTSHLNLQYYTEKEEMTTNPFNLTYLGYEGDSTFNDWEKTYDFILGIGDSTIRKKLAKLLISKNKKLLNVIDASSLISEHIQIGQGNFIGKNVVVNVQSDIGDYCILNTGCIVEHDCSINDGVHIAPGAVLCGNVVVGENTFIGANSTIKQGVKIGDNVIIGAGSVVLRDVPNNETFYGNPANRRT